MAVLLKLVHSLHNALVRLPHEILVLVWVFWIIQFIGWMIMMMYVQFFNQGLGNKTLYVTQISHWALVEAAGTAVLSTWALIQAKHHQDRAEQLHADSQKDKA